MLYNAAGGALAESRNLGTSPEHIARAVGAGRYYVRVYPYQGRSSQPYRLTAAWGAVGSGEEEILDGIEDNLRYEPTRESRSRIKRLELLDSPAYRLRVGDYRVFYDVDMVTATVSVLRVMSKEESLVYLAELERRR